jgi:hypothetical protein
MPVNSTAPTGNKTSLAPRAPDGVGFAVRRTGRGERRPEVRRAREWRRRAADRSPRRASPMAPSLHHSSRGLAPGMMGPMEMWDDASNEEEGRAPICPYCGVTTLPAELSRVLDTDSRATTPTVRPTATHRPFGLHRSIDGGPWKLSARVSRGRGSVENVSTSAGASGRPRNTTSGSSRFLPMFLIEEACQAESRRTCALGADTAGSLRHPTKALGGTPTGVVHPSCR